MKQQNIILSDNLEDSLNEAIDNCSSDKIFLLTDEHTHTLCLNHLLNIPP